MKLHLFERTQRLAMEPGAAWEFFTDPRNLAVITPPEMGFQVTSPLPERVYAGMIVTYRVRPLLGVAVTWVTEITHVREGEYFVDEQRFGPYRFWHHQHLFRPVPGGVEMRDIVHYALPPGAGAARRWLVAPRLEHIFDYRGKVLRDRFGLLA